ncbi:hypothetical protein ACRRTK_005150 [Alexandromys fortis]
MAGAAPQRLPPADLRNCRPGAFPQSEVKFCPGLPSIRERVEPYTPILTHQDTIFQLQIEKDLEGTHELSEASQLVIASFTLTLAYSCWEGSGEVDCSTLARSTAVTSIFSSPSQLGSLAETENALIVHEKGVLQNCQDLNIYSEPGCRPPRVAFRKKITEISTSAKMSHPMD